MLIRAMKHGETVKEYRRNSITRPFDGRTIDLSYASHSDRMMAVLYRFGDFVESFSDEDDRGYYCGIIRNCGDNCIKIYPEESAR